MSALRPKADIATYSITSSARASSAGGTVVPSALAAIRLITISNVVGCSTGMGVEIAYGLTKKGIIDEQ